MDDALHDAPIGAIETTPAGQITAVNETATAIIDSDADTLVDTAIEEGFPSSAAGTLREAFADTPPSATEFTEYYPEIDRWLAVTVEPGEPVRVYVQDRTAEHAADRRADRLERRLDRVQRIDSLIVTVLQRVIGAADRSEVARTVCDGLGGTDRYEFVWVGDRDFPNDRLRVVSTAGSAPELRERIDAALGDSDAMPGQTAVASGDTHQVPAFAADETVPREVRQAAFSHGLQSCLAVPLQYQGTVYGVVSVYSGEEDGFSEQERAGLETLGRVAGFAIKATRQEDLLVADTVTEVTLQLHDDSLPLVAAAADAETTLSLDGAVPQGDGPVVCYLTADDTAGVEAALESAAGVDDVSWVRTETDPLVQVTVTGETPETVLVGWGATITEATYRPRDAEVVVEAPPDESIRRLIEAVDTTVEETELVAKSETARETASIEAFQDALDDRLTDRQRTVLRTAYLADYFESPRGSTSEEVADALDIAGPTMLHHLRRAERKLVDAFLSTTPETRPSSDQ